MIMMLAASAFAEGDPESLSERIDAALDLPQAAQDLRKAGVPPNDVGKCLEAARERGLNAGQSRDLLRETRKSVDTHGPVDNFGAFVQSKLDEGLRGQELAAAIHAEHEARGKGKQQQKGKGPHGNKGSKLGEGGQGNKKVSNPTKVGKHGKMGKSKGGGK